MSDTATPIQGEAEVVEPVQETPVQDPTTSVLAGLKAHRKQLGVNAKPLKLKVPGYDGDLLLEFHWVPFTELSKSAQNFANVTEQGELQLLAATDTLIKAHTQFLIHVSDENVPLAPKDADGSETSPVTFADPRLAGLLGFDTPKNARDAVKKVFVNDYALIQTAEVVFAWLKDTTVQIDKDLLGN